MTPFVAAPLLLMHASPLHYCYMYVQHMLHFTRGLIKLPLQETPDRNPILGQHPHHLKIIFGLGFSGMGIGLPRVALSLLIINGM